jgi:AAA+ superfamily predicted ATPase
MDNQSNFLINPALILKSKILENVYGKIKTDKFYFDLPIYIILQNLQDNFEQLIRSVEAKRYILWVILMCKKLINYIRGKENVNKYLEVRKITEGCEINKIFPKILWYLQTLATKNKDNDKMCIETTEALLDTPIFSPIVSDNNTIIYKDTEISYHVSKEVKSIYTHSKIERENQIIKISAKIPKESTLLIDLYQDAIKEYDKHKKEITSERNIYINNDKGEWVSQKMSKTNKEIDIHSVILRNGCLSEYIASLDKFAKSEDFYKKKGKEYKFTYLLYGIPGTGKSFLIKASAKYLNRNIYYIVLSSVKDDQQLLNLFKNIKCENSILVFEDIDCISDIIKKRTIITEEEKKEKSELTLSSLLNFLDGGMVDKYGLIIYMTTNHIDNLDEALIRSGRVNKKIEFKYADAKQIQELYYDYFGIQTTFNAVTKNICPANIVDLMIEHLNDADKAKKAINDIIS